MTIQRPTDSNPIGGLLVMSDASASLEKVTLAGNDGNEFGSTYESMKTSLELKGCAVEGGARANGISTFKADFASREDYRP